MWFPPRYRFAALCCVSLVIVGILFRQYSQTTYAPAASLPTTLDQTVQNNPIRNITRTLVVPLLKDADQTWIPQQLSSEPDLTTAIYIVDDPQPPYIVPANKGHEAMAYLTYIIDHYSNLSDVTIFIHGEFLTWHNNDLQASNSATMIRQLSSAKVLRDGYMNMRCHLDPGCPDHIHPVVPGSSSSDDTLNIPEAVIIGSAWLSLFPTTTHPPAVLSQPCCAQFAVSKSRLLSIPLSSYTHYRTWLLTTDLADRLSGRVFEYVWQFLFGLVHEFCPEEHVCYCDGYGYCFGGAEEYAGWFELRARKRERERVLEETGMGEVAEKEGLKSEIGLRGSSCITGCRRRRRGAGSQRNGPGRRGGGGGKGMGFEWDRGIETGGGLARLTCRHRKAPATAQCGSPAARTLSSTCAVLIVSLSSSALLQD